MTHPETCTFVHKNDILSRIEDILCWTKNENKTWYDNAFFTTIATTVLLRLGHSEKDLNLQWIEDQLDKFQKSKDHFNSITLFCAFCLGLLSLNYTKRKSRRETSNLAKELLQELNKLNWMNTPKTVAFLTLLLKEINFTEEVTNEASLSRIQGYLLDFIQQEALDLERLSYALFSLSLLKPSIVKNYVIDHKNVINKLTNHNRIELRALTLDALDKAEIRCAETTYQGIWDYFNKKSYGTVERSLIQRIISAVYSKMAGLPFDQKDTRIKEENTLVHIEVDIAKSSLDNMVANMPPIDQLSIVALSILWSNYDKLYFFSRRRFEEYETLTNLENKDTHIPVEKETVSKVTKKVFRYELEKILLKYGILTALAIVILPLASSYVAGLATFIPDPWSKEIAAVAGLIFGVFSFFKWIFSNGRKDFAELKTKSEQLRSKGKWQVS